jgi:phenylalanine-4-hydroxylase
MLPVAGLVSSRRFLGQLADGIFLSTQYVRHPSKPLYTPEPDLIHEVIGHAASLVHPLFAQLNRSFGRAAKAADDHLLEQLERVYWYTLEFGAVEEAGALKVYGAGLLSSFGELGRFERSAELRPLVLDEVVQTPYDPTRYQDTIYVATCFEALCQTLLSYLDAIHR